jgi:hypothetical protein
MSFNVRDFKEKLIGGGARPTLFKVDLATPFNTGINTLASFMIEATSLPASTIGRIEVPYMGRKIAVAGDRTFDAWQVTIINDEDFQIRHAMEEWHNKINSLEGNLMNTGSTSAPSNYKRDAQVKQYGKSSQDKILRQYNYVGLFPVEISAIDLDWNRTDEIERFQVTFAYDYYTISGGPASLT